MSRRPILADAVNFARQLPAPADDAFLLPEPAATVQPEPRCGVLVRVSDDVRHRLKLVALQRGTTVQTMLLEAITAILDAPINRRGL